MSKVLFTDEKIFTVEPLHNGRNRRQLLKKGQQKTAAAKTIGRSHFSSSVIVWSGICATGKTLLILIDRNVKINDANYQQLDLRDVLKPWATEHFGPEGFVLQQNWVPAHSTNVVLEELFLGFWSKDIWPPNSLNLNPMDYSVWTILEQKIWRTRYATVEAIKAALTRDWDKCSITTTTNSFIIYSSY